MALQYITDLMSTTENILFVIWGFFKKSNTSELDALIAFIRSMVLDDEKYVRRHTAVIFTDDPESLSENLKFTIFVHIPPSTDEERRTLISEVASKVGVKYSEGLVDATRGLSLHEVESVILETLAVHKNLEDLSIAREYKQSLVAKSGILEFHEPTHGFEAVGGYSELKEFVARNFIAPIKNPERAKKLGLRLPRGLLFFGFPGVGKTWFAKAMAKEIGLPLLILRGEKIVSKWYGETTKLIAKAIRTAEDIAPCLLFIDEIDRFGRRGGLTEHEETRRAFSVLLEWLGDPSRKTIVIGTTNRPEDLDEAFRRTGRFDYLLPFLLPDYEARLEILKVHTTVVNRVPTNVDLAEIARRTENWTGAELEELIQRSARSAFVQGRDTVTAEDFETALATFNINTSERAKRTQHYLELAKEFSTDTSFLPRATQKTRLDALKPNI